MVQSRLATVVVLAVVQFAFAAVEASIRGGHFHRDLQQFESDALPKERVNALFGLYNQALLSLDASAVSSRYAKDAVLITNENDFPKTSNDAILEYYESFLQMKPFITIQSSDIMIGDEWAQHAGTYELFFGTTGQEFKCRFTMVYVMEDGVYKIAHHHSSVLPESQVRGVDITESEVRAMFDTWNEALATLDPKEVTDLYSETAVLLPTVSDIPRTNHKEIEAYFEEFLLNKPQGEILESYVSVGTNWAEDVGIYEFTMGTTGAKVKARYTYVYMYNVEQEEWKIQHHHSSQMPEARAAAIPNPEPIDEEGVHDLFLLWNSALATLDAKNVTSRYSKEAVLLPTVSDTPRNTPELIEDYFIEFLKKEPQGVIQSSEISIGYNYARDAGIYLFTMGVDGSQVEARYTFVYVFEDGEWKISQHHSSVMPEAFL